MLMKHRFLLTILLCMPFWGVDADAANVKQLAKTISAQTDFDRAVSAYKEAFNQLKSQYSGKVSDPNINEKETDLNNKIIEARNGNIASSTGGNAGGTAGSTTTTDNTDKLEEAKQKYEDAKEKEQSTANKTLTALTTAATGIGGMELARGLSEQKADKDAEQDMEAYISTMRCTYADGKSVKAGPDEIELPGGNNSDLMNYRAEYFALAQDLQDRKAALGLKPGIESEVVLDKTSLSLYDDESVGITNGSYASLYRAQMLESEDDQAKLAEDAKASKNRVIAGAVVGGVGVVGGMIGDSLINGKLGERLKQAIAEKKVGKETQALLKKEAEALKDLQNCLDKSGVKEVDNLSFSEFYPSILSVKGIKCTPLSTWVNPTAQGLFTDTTDAKNIFDTLVVSFGYEIAGKMIGMSNVSLQNRSQAIQKVEQLIKDIQKKFDDAAEKDKEAADKAGISIGNIADALKDSGLANKANLFSGVDFDASTGGTGFLSTYMNK